jgi:hypothetical protein
MRLFPERTSVGVPMQQAWRRETIRLEGGAQMAVQVEAARIPDRDRLLRELRETGLDARPVGEIGIEVRHEGEPEGMADQLFVHAERVIMSIGAPFVPIKHEGVIYIRPPLS